MPTDKNLPAEWAPQSGVLLSWPTSNTDWRNNLAEVAATYIELVKAICLISHAYICCDDENCRDTIKKTLKLAGIEEDSYSLYTLPYNDTWTRDYGPISVISNDVTYWLDFTFNAWGDKFISTKDDQLSALLHPQYDKKVTLKKIDFVLEGGSIDSDGEGSLLTTSQCLLQPTRNNGLTKKQIEDLLIPLFGLKRILWLDHGSLAGDDTDAHIDTLARFCAIDTIAYVQCTNKADAHYESLARMEEQLQAFKQLNGLPYKLIPLPHATACFNTQGQQLPASYANFLILNGRVIAPVYGVGTDAQAMAQLAHAFPSYKIIPIQCRSLIGQFGSLHCVTMQML